VGLFYNINDVMHHNNAMLADIKGPTVNIGMAAEVLAQRGQEQVNIPLARQNLLKVAFAEVWKRLYLVDSDPTSRVLKTKVGVPLMVAQSVTADAMSSS
jgi:hypothetical protein